MLDAIVWFFKNIALAFSNFFYAVTHPAEWLAWVGEINVSSISTVEVKQALMRFIYYGGSIEFFFFVFTVVLLVTIAGLIRRQFMWNCVIGLEAVANFIGRLAAWAGLLMVLQQIMIVFMQRIFTAAQISIGFGSPLTRDVSWWAEELKLFNAIIVCLCVTYTFVQGGHVRVDLVYSAVSYRTKKVIDMFGALVFMMPGAVLTWMYGWYFMWRHLVTPKPSASDSLDKLLTKSRALRWNVETIGFSPNGFDAYFLFKILLVIFAALVFLHSVAFFYRSFLEFVEGPESEGKYLDRDSLGDGEEAYEGTH
ncbi:C4-dicarboxylate ABC transporter permease [Actibacterium mucosum KCTC 23349]|uniref:TRAP transporter small permease protein n=1 Tax=Actibacterium mucosum KCTC 23349 TaxID=1454373 RepID=A0A037ZIB2_9RHOB|nr:TRAP transporter small permease subunit [Actibacterium mucosum]KAJ54555.1 C4-dicarboxylate ABC transporter permease [Actibacterium mucosum KCTC 23349]